MGVEGTSSHYGHKSKTHSAPDTRVGGEGSSKRNISRKGGFKVQYTLVYQFATGTFLTAAFFFRVYAETLTQGIVVCSYHKEILTREL